MQFHRALRGLLACAVLALNCGASLAQSPVRDTTPITETCNGGGDQSTTVSYAGPSSLQPGKPERVRVTVRNTSPASTLWFGEQTSVPTRLAAWNSSLQGHNNQVAWDGWECGGYRKDGVGNQRAFISDPTSPDDRCHAPGSVSPPSGERTFDFNITAPLGSSGTVKLSWAMVVEFGGACNGFFPEAWYVDIPVSGPDVRCNTDPGPKPGDSYWLLEVWNNETLDTIVPQDGQRTQDSFPVERRWISSDFATDSTGSVTLPINGGATRLSECAGLAHYTARLTRDVPLRAGTYTLKASADDGVRMTVNGASVFNKWTAPQVIPVDAPETARRTATNDGSYTFVIEYLQASGGGQMNVNWALEGTPTPQPPTLRLDSVNNLNASLSWTSVSGAARYSLKRSQSQGGPYSEVQNVSSTFANDAVGQAGTYYYVVTASVNGVDTGFSNEVPVTFNGTPPPGPPTLRLDGVNGLNASLSWTSVTGATRYSLKRSQTQGGPYSEVQNVSSTFANDTVSGGGTYYYVVTALVNGVNTNLSNEVPVTFSGPPTPQPPRLQLDSVNNLTASLSWTSVTSASRYSLKRSQTQGGPYSEVQNVSSTFANDSVSGGGTYYYVVSAFVNGVNTDFSNEVPVTFSGTPTPQPPRLQLDSVQDLTASLSWTSVTNASSYSLKRSGTQGGPYSEVQARSSISATDTVNTAGTYYYVVTASVNGVDTGPSNEVAVTFTQGPPVTDPTFKLEIRAPDDSVIAPEATLSRNGDGCPSPNPIKLQLLVSCPSTRPNGCLGALDVTVRSDNGQLRINGITTDPRCHQDQTGPSFHSMHWRCPAALGAINVGPGTTLVIPIGVVVQPSGATNLIVTASWAGTLSASQRIWVDAAAIHPLVIAPGILGTMPPAYGRGEFDPQLGVYAPLMAQLEALGYEEGVTMFRFPYDWRNSNRVTARYLRDRIREALAASRAAAYVATDNKADLLVHSMGGVITRTLVEGEGVEANGAALVYNPATEGIRKVIFASTPHRGFPEDYRTYESGNWTDFLGDTPLLDLGMNGLLWPALIKKHWAAAHPGEALPGGCIATQPQQPPTCVFDYSKMMHDAVGGIDSMREMLPTPDIDAHVQPFFGEYLCDSYSPVATTPCTGPYPYGVPRRPVNTLLPVLNARVASFASAIGADNIYVIYGTDPDAAHQTDVVYDVKAPPAVRSSPMVGWVNGEVEGRFTTPAGDDLIPEYSSNLKLLIPSIPDANVAGFRIVGGVPKYGLPGNAFRHKEIMWSYELQGVYAPKWLAGLGPIPYFQTYVQPSVVGALARGTGWIVSGECPVNLLLTDANGVPLLGYDPDTGIRHAAMADSIYAAPNSENQFMLLGNPAPGRYRLKVSAFADGDFRLSLHQLSTTGTPRRWLAEGTVHTGQVNWYDIDLDPTLPNANRPPIADAGPDQTVQADPAACVASVRLDGSRSSDPDGEALTFDWSGPFGRAAGAQPLVTLKPGSHDITLLVQDGQLKGAQAHTRVDVLGIKPVIVSIAATPERLEPADNTMRDVRVTVDVSSVCGTATCRIVEIEADEGDSSDWKITGPLTAKLRAKRDGDGNGRRYKLRVECQVAGAEPAHKTVYVRVPPPGRMKGDGKVHHDEREYDYKFDVSESIAGKDAGSVSVEMKSEDDKQHKLTDKFRSTKVDYVRFWDDDDLEAGGNAKVNTVKATGVGTWNGKSGYSFEIRATDDGEPGKNHDRFRITVRDAQGKTVMHVDEEIDSGNNQSTKPPK